MDPIDILPEEVLIVIFSIISWRHLQKKCTLVSKKWFNFIRNSAQFSSKFATTQIWKKRSVVPIHIEDLQKSWPVLKTIHLKRMDALDFYSKNGFINLQKINFLPKLEFISIQTENWGLKSASLVQLWEIESPLFAEECEFSVKHLKNLREKNLDTFFSQKVEEKYYKHITKIKIQPVNIATLL